MSDENKDHTSTTNPALGGAGTTADTTSTSAMAGSTGGSAAAMGGTSASATSSDQSKSAKDMAWETKEAARNRAEELGETAKSEASAMAEKGKSAAYAKADEAKGRGADEVERTAEQLRAAGREFGEGSYAYEAADYLATSLHDAADVLRSRDLNTMVDDVTQFARRNPGVFLGGAAMVGFFAARMLKASDRNRGYDYDADYDRGYDADRYGYDAPPAGIDHTPHAAKTASPTYPAAGTGGTTTATGAAAGTTPTGPSTTVGGTNTATATGTGSTTAPSTTRSNGGLS